MANRLNGDIIIVDSAMGNAPILGSASNLTSFRIGAISFFRLSTASTIIITRANTSLDVVFNSNMVMTGVIGTNMAVNFENPIQVTFPGGMRTNDLKIPTLTAGTAYIYLQ